MPKAKPNRRGSATAIAEGGSGPPPRRTAPDLTRTERWYLDCLVALTKSLGRPPIVLELANWIDRTSTPTYRVLTKLESLGLVTRDGERRFVVVEGR